MTDFLASPEPLTVLIIKYILWYLTYINIVNIPGYIVFTPSAFIPNNRYSYLIDVVSFEPKLYRLSIYIECSCFSCAVSPF